MVKGKKYFKIGTVIINQVNSSNKAKGGVVTGH